MRAGSIDREVQGGEPVLIATQRGYGSCADEESSPATQALPTETARGGKIGDCRSTHGSPGVHWLYGAVGDLSLS